MTFCYLCNGTMRKSFRQDRFTHVHCLKELKEELNKLRYEVRESKTESKSLSDYGLTSANKVKG